VRNTVAPHAVRQTMTEYDLIAVPSRWLETGPLVALEAFAAGVPVLGADLGGIAEIVRNGVDGVLVQSDDVNAWSAAILKLARNRALIEELKRNIRSPRTMDDVAHDMAALYGRCNAGA
jgi:glycosyltransferase involved in cell wall biosynthesis